MKRKYLPLRLFIYITGMMAAALGFCVILRTDMGDEALSFKDIVLPNGFSVGVSAIVFAFFCLFNVLEIFVHLFSKKFRSIPLDLLQIPFALLYAYLFEVINNSIGQLPFEIGSLEENSGLFRFLGVVFAGSLISAMGLILSNSANIDADPVNGFISAVKGWKGGYRAAQFSYFITLFGMLGFAFAMNYLLEDMSMAPFVSIIVTGIFVTTLNKFIGRPLREKFVDIEPEEVFSYADPAAVAPPVENIPTQTADSVLSETAPKATVFFESYKPENSGAVTKPRSVLIKDTTREERMEIVNSSLGGDGDSYEATCEGMGNVGKMYQPYIDGIKELYEINEENSNYYIS